MRLQNRYPLSTWFAPRQFERADRYVHRCCVRSGAQESRSRITFLIEEALRLVKLPGEDQGRIYYFREISVATLSTGTSRQAWIDGFRVVLLDTANRAIHGADHRAGSSDAVFFSNHQEALELLLNRMLRRGSVAQWFWPLVSGAPGEASRSERVLAVIERLRELPASWLAAAGSVINAIGRDEPTALLAMLPVAIVNSWLRELGQQNSASAHSRAIQLPSATADSLRRAMHTLGRHDPRLVWLASLAVVQASPSALSNGMVVATAQATLHRLPAECAASIGDHQNYASVCSYAARPGADQDPVAALAFQHSTPELFPGVPTRAAGLYFLLNVLKLQGIAEALHLNPAAAERGLVVRVMKRLATVAGIEANDPILGWINLSLSQTENSSTRSADASIATGPSLFPSNLRPSSRALVDTEYLSRVWSIAVRRWCWRTGKLAIREVVSRNGFVSLNRTDLDVTLSLDEADVRIRRLGLDIDPGWLPWFGMVVRFHYVWAENPHVH